MFDAAVHAFGALHPTRHRATFGRVRRVQPGLLAMKRAYFSG